MARTVCVVALALAMFCVAVTAQTVPQWAKPGQKNSRWGGHHYWPIKTDKAWTYYRMYLKLNITVAETWDNNPATTALFVGTSIGDVFDYTTKAKIGVFQAFTVSTGTEASMPGGPITVGTMSNLVIELGPSGDDSITTSGATSTQISSGTQIPPFINDADNAVTGGVGRYLGAAGEFKYQSFVGTEIDALLELWVPKLSSNW